MRELGFAVSATKISSVVNGHRSKAGGFTWQASDLSTSEILSQDPELFIEYIPAKNSNARQKVKLTCVEDKTERTFDSKSDAARFLKSAPGNITRAIRQNGTIKGYKAELIKDE